MFVKISHTQIGIFYIKITLRQYRSFSEVKLILIICNFDFKSLFIDFVEY